MGKKLHPKGIRLGVIRTRPSVWYAGKNLYSKYLLADLSAREFLFKKCCIFAYQSDISDSNAS